MSKKTDDVKLENGNNISDNVFKTFNYDDFVFLPENRDINENKLKQLIFSMTKKFVKRPIDVKIMTNKENNGKFGITDGQHRYLACKELGLPIYYMINDTLDVSMIPTINIASTWKDIDFIKSFAKQGNPNFIKILDLMKLFPEIKFPRIYMMICGCKYGTHNNNGIYESEIRDGTFVFDKFDEAVETCKKIMDYEVVKTEFKNSAWGKYSFFVALLKLFKNVNYNHYLVIKKVNANPRDIIKQHSVSDYIKNINQVYNHRNPNKVYFETYL